MKLDEYDSGLSPEPDMTPAATPEAVDTPTAEPQISDQNATDTPGRVEDAATEPAALPMGGTSLLGTLLGHSDPRALVRLRGGEIRTLRPGDRINRATVQAIEPGALILVENGTARRLGMPGG